METTYRHVRTGLGNGILNDGLMGVAARVGGQLEGLQLEGSVTALGNVVSQVVSS